MAPSDLGGLLGPALMCSADRDVDRVILTIGRGSRRAVGGERREDLLVDDSVSGSSARLCRLIIQQVCTRAGRGGSQPSVRSESALGSSPRRRKPPQRFRRFRPVSYPVYVHIQSYEKNHRARGYSSRGFIIDVNGTQTDVTAPRLRALSAITRGSFHDHRALAVHTPSNMSLDMFDRAAYRLVDSRPDFARKLRH